MRGHIDYVKSVAWSPDGHNVPLIMEEDGRIRKLTPRECFRLQGLPDSYKFPKGMSNASLYKLAGNAITMTVARAIAKNLAELSD